VLCKIFKPKGFKVCRPYLVGCKRHSFLHFKRYNLIINVVNVFKKNSTPNFNSWKQDPTVEFQK
jgi:hypothetical protein